MFLFCFVFSTEKLTAKLWICFILPVHSSGHIGTGFLLLEGGSWYMNFLFGDQENLVQGDQWGLLFVIADGVPKLGTLSVCNVDNGISWTSYMYSSMLFLEVCFFTWQMNSSFLWSRDWNLWLFQHKSNAAEKSQERTERNFFQVKCIIKQKRRKARTHPFLFPRQ